MSSKNKKIVVASPEIAVTEIKSETGRVSIATKDYLAIANRSGDPLLIANEKTRLYSNPRRNGTTFVILAALAAVTKDKVAYTDLYEKGIIALERDNFNNPDWRRLEANYKRGENRSASPTLKRGPVLSAIKLRLKKSALIGFDISGIADPETRSIYGFSF
jgi:hypothetical protein